MVLPDNTLFRRPLPCPAPPHSPLPSHAPPLLAHRPFPPCYLTSIFLTWWYFSIVSFLSQGNVVLEMSFTLSTLFLQLTFIPILYFYHSTYFYSSAYFMSQLTLIPLTYFSSLSLLLFPHFTFLPASSKSMKATILVVFFSSC